MSPHGSPLMTFLSIGLPLSPFSSSPASPHPTEATRFPSQGVEKHDNLPPALAEDVADQLEEFLVAVPGLAGQGGGGGTLCSLLLHQLMLPLLGL